MPSNGHTADYCTDHEVYGAITFSPPGRKSRGSTDHDNRRGYAVTYEMGPKRLGDYERHATKIPIMTDKSSTTPDLAETVHQSRSSNFKHNDNSDNEKIAIQKNTSKVHCNLARLGSDAQQPPKPPPPPEPPPPPPR